MIDSARLESIVREAGRIAYDLWPGTGHDLRCWEKEPGSPVCDADLAVDAFLKRELTALLPAAGWLSEETADAPDRLERDLIWLVDPVDGTRDFVRGRSGWCGRGGARCHAGAWGRLPQRRARRLWGAAGYGRWGGRRPDGRDATNRRSAGLGVAETNRCRLLGPVRISTRW